MTKYIFAVSFFVSIVIFAGCEKSNPTDNGNGGTTPADVAPEAPSNMRILSMDESSVLLSWKDNSATETEFDIEQGIDSLNFSIVKSVAANVDSVTISSVFSVSQTYYFRVKAKTATKTSTSSNIVSRCLFPAPTNLQILAMTPSGVSLTWNDASATESSFDIEQSVDNGVFTVAGSAPANATAIALTGTFDSSATYAFRICGRTATSKSVYSNAASCSMGDWILVGSGSFQMGRNGEFRDEQPIHTVTLSKSYSIGKYEVTVKQFREFTSAENRTFPPTPSWGWNDDDPIVNISWNDARDYCQWLSDTLKKVFRLPTEAEWEFAARGGKYSQGYIYSGSNSLSDVAWCFANASSCTHTVGTKRPNELGIYDMSGNAWEWCADWYGSYGFQAQTNPTGPVSGSTKIFRGGSWFDYGLGASDGRVETRYDYTPNSRATDSGFRVVKEL
jgi:formylglycine-generating enzyme required for sulfatase activity